MSTLKQRRRAAEAVLVIGIVAAVAGAGAALLGGGSHDAERPAPRAQASGAAVRVATDGPTRFRAAGRVEASVRLGAGGAGASSAGPVLTLRRNGIAVVRQTGGRLALRDAAGTVAPVGVPSGASTLTVRLDVARQRVRAQLSGQPAVTAATRVVPENGVAAASATRLAGVRAVPFVPRLFSPRSVWNQRLSPTAPLDPKSATYVAGLRRQIRQSTAWINTTQYSIPVYTVGPGQRTQRVKLDVPVPKLQRAFDRVPLPAAARSSNGTDSNIAVYQPSTDSLWEFWLARKQGNQWHARWGGRIDGVSGNPGHFAGADRFWGASASSLAVMGGLIRPDELRRGRIDHAVALAVPRTLKGRYSLPAQRTDGWSSAPDALPQGARFRLDPKLDLSKLRLNPTVRAIAEAAQRYGIVLRDTSGAVTFYAEAPKPGEGNPYAGANGLFKTANIGQTLNDEFPWQHLQVLRTEMRTQTARASGGG